MDRRRSGIVAVGDQLVNGHTAPVGWVPGRSFVLWVARSAKTPCVRYGGAEAPSSSVLAELQPHAGHGYRFGIVSMGAVDAQRGDLSTLESNLRGATRLLLARCDRVAMLSVQSSNAADSRVRSVATALRVPVIDSTLSGRHLIGADLMHPTALGQLLLADRVARHWGLPLPSSARGLRGPEHRDEHQGPVGRS